MIRPARRADHDALLELWLGLMQAGAQADPRYQPTPDARAQMRHWTRDAWFEPAPFPRVLVAEGDGALDGFIHGFPRVAVPVVSQAPTVRIGDLFVRPEARRAGVGRALVASLRRQAAAAGFPRAEVGTLTADVRAQAFWRAVGFGDWQVLLSSEAT